MKKHLLIVMLSTLILFATSSAITLDTEQREELNRITKVFFDIKSIKTEFIQTSDKTPTVIRGWFAMKRPGKIRVDYTPKIPVILIINSGVLLSYDAELKEKTQLPIQSSPLRLLIAEKASFEDPEITISDFKMKDGITSISIYETKNKELGTLTIRIKGDNLIGWQTIDVRSQIISIELVNPIINSDIANNIFNVNKIVNVKKEDLFK